MSAFSKILLAAVAALSGVAASAHTDVVDHPGFKAKSVIASHEATPTLSAVAHHVRHHRHRHHRVHHPR